MQMPLIVDVASKAGTRPKINILKVLIIMMY